MKKKHPLEGSYRLTPHAGQVCDFCLAPNPRWSFDGPDINAPVQALAGTMVQITDNGVWASCTRCSMLVRAGRVERLAEVAAHGSVRMGAPYSPEHHAWLLQRFKRVLPRFGARRVPTPKERASKGGLDVTSIDMQSN